MPTNPMYLSGFHRYVLLVYKQEAYEEDFDGRHMTRRASFHTRDFAEEFGMEGPIAMNYFMAEATHA